jgi:hypothetical protein
MLTTKLSYGKLIYISYYDLYRYYFYYTADSCYLNLA